MRGIFCTAGLFLASLALHLAAPARRFCPEPIGFALRLLRSALPPEQARQQQQQQEDPHAPGTWLHLAGCKNGRAAAAPPVQPLQLTRALGSAPGDAYFGSGGFRASALAAAMGLVARAAELFGGIPSLPEMLAPAQAALEALGSSAPGLPEVRLKIRSVQNQIWLLQTLRTLPCPDVHARFSPTHSWDS